MSVYLAIDFTGNGLLANQILPTPERKPPYLLMDASGIGALIAIYPCQSQTQIIGVRNLRGTFREIQKRQKHLKALDGPYSHIGNVK